MIRQEKQMLRTQMRERLGALTAAERAAASGAIRFHLRQHEAWQGARVIYGFAPLDTEPDWWSGDWPDGVTLVLPRIDDGIMRFFAVQSRDDLQAGAFGILEPRGENPAPPPDLAVIPGLAFDSDGRRLGRGRGFYDRFLEKIPHVPVIGVCFARQMVESLPIESHDIHMNAVVTENGLIVPTVL